MRLLLGRRVVLQHLALRRKEMDNARVHRIGSDILLQGQHVYWLYLTVGTYSKYQVKLESCLCLRYPGLVALNSVKHVNTIQLS